MTCSHAFERVRTRGRPQKSSIARCSNIIYIRRAHVDDVRRPTHVINGVRRPSAKAYAVDGVRRTSTMFENI